MFSMTSHEHLRYTLAGLMKNSSSVWSKLASMYTLLHLL